MPTWIPLLRAVPAATLIAVSTDEVFRFGILVSAVLPSCTSVINPTLSRPGEPSTRSISGNCPVVVISGNEESLWLYRED